MSAGLDDTLSRSLLLGSNRIEVTVTGDFTAVLVKALAADSRVPVGGLPSSNTRGEGIGKVSITEAAKTKQVLQLFGGVGVLSMDNNVVNDINEVLGDMDTVLRSLLTDGLKVLPVIVYGLGHTRGRNGSPEDIRVLGSEEGLSTDGLVWKEKPKPPELDTPTYNLSTSI